MMLSSSRVLIVGAGAAGIAAAARLFENGITDIIILEAERRIGGRVHTTKFGNGLVDLGAQWVHGEKENIVSSMAKPLGLLGETLTEVTDSKFVTSSGILISGDTIEKYLGPLMKILEESGESLKLFKGSLGEYLTNEFEKHLKENGIESRNEKANAKYFLDWFAKFENSIDGSDSWFYTSGPGHTHYRDCEGNLLQAWKSGGYHSVFDLLLRKYPDPSKSLPVESKILFNKEVVNIEWDNTESNRVNVKCSDGTDYITDHVIVTTSLGVLKERSKSLFTPELPAKKLIAIYGLSIGTVDKIYIRFPHQWWPEGSLGFSFLWNEDDEKNFNSKHPTESGRHWLTDVFGFYEVDHNPGVLCGWVVGPSARIMEKLTDAELNKGCMELLNMFLDKNYKIPQPVEILRTTWSLNPHFRGSYSFRSTDSDAVDTYAAHLAEPVSNSSGKHTLLFAGEATHEHFFSTVHGAIESGQREADRLIKLFSFENKSCGRNLSICDGVSKHYKVAIVGGGIAGLAAAKTLCSAGVQNTIILEAQDHPGGRVLSLPLNGGWVEAGAQWIHGEKNPVWKLADEYHLLSKHTSSEGEGPYIREDGLIFEASMVFEIDKVISDILEECEEFSNEGYCSGQIPHSIGEYMKTRFAKYLDSCPNDSPKQREMKEELFDWHVRFQIIDNSSSMLDQLSAKAWGNYSFCGGTDYVNFEFGYSSLIEKITGDLPDGVLKLNMPVNKIIWKENISEFESDTDNDNCDNLLPTKVVCPVVIHCGSDVKISADHCIVTCSLGYLKEHHHTMFDPGLPKSMIQTIQHMGFATINKIYLDFREPWWENDIKGFQLIWSKNSKAFDLPDSWTRDLTGFDVLPNHPGVLLGWIGGRGAELVEDISEEVIGQHCTKLLRQFTQRLDIPEPSKVLRTQWRKNPYIRGGYSNTTSMCDSTNSGPSTLAEPIYSDINCQQKSKHPLILLAGEATHDCYFSTTHGAFESGQKQARVVLEYLGLK